MNDAINKLKHTPGQHTIHGDIKPLKGKVLVRDLEWGEVKTKNGLIIPDDDGNERGIRPRWAQVWKVGTDVNDIKEGQWVLVSHGRWSRTVNVDNGEESFRVNLIDFPEAVLMYSDEKPNL